MTRHRTTSDSATFRHAGLLPGVCGAALALLLAGPAPAAAASVRAFGASTESARSALGEHVMRTLDGRALQLSAFRGEVVVVNFWASWCAPCRKELPALAALHRELKGKGGNVVAVSIDEDRRNAERFIRSNRIDLPVAHDGPSGLARQLDLKNVPLTIVIDRDGSIAYTTSGSDARSLEELAARTRKLVTRTPVAARAMEGDTP